MIKKYSEFLREFIENSDSIINSKLEELEELVSNFSDKNLLYQWENKNDHEVTINFSINDLAIQYIFDIDDLNVTKTAGGEIDFQTGVESIDEGLDVIEKDIYMVLGISESFRGEWDSSIKLEEVSSLMNEIVRISKVVEHYGLYESDGLVSEMESLLKNYDNMVIEFVVDTLLFTQYPTEDSKDDKKMEIIRLGDKIMSRFGTEPFQVVNAMNDGIRLITGYYHSEDEVLTESRKGRAKSARYKGRKIPGKYLSGPHPGKMKKEIDTYAGKNQYKKDWDADYKSGKGGRGKRVKTKKSAATKAYQRMFGK